MDKSQNGGADIYICPFFQPISQSSAIVGAFRADDDAVCPAFFHLPDQAPCQLFTAEGNFGNKDVFGTAGNSRIKGYISRKPPHDFNDSCPVVGRGSIADTADRTHYGIDRRIMADGFISTVHIIVYGAGYGYSGYAKAGQGCCPLDGTIAADDDKPFYPVIF